MGPEEGWWWLHYSALQQQPFAQLGLQDSMPVVTQTYAKYPVGSPQVSSSLSELSLPVIPMLVLWCLFSISSSSVVHIGVHQVGAALLF